MPSTFYAGQTDYIDKLNALWDQGSISAVPQTIAVNSASPALTITQDGSGNALEVRDVTSDTTPFVVDANGDARFGGSVVMTGAAPSLNIGSNGVSTGACVLEIGNGRTGSGFAYIDLISDTTYTDFGFRILRGADGSGAMTHRGVGDLAIVCQDAANFTIQTNSAERMRIDSSGNVGIGAAPDALFALDITRNTNGVAATRIRNNSTGPVAQAINQIVVGGRYINQLVDYTAQYYQVGSSGITTSYTDIDTQIFRDSAGTEHLRIASTGLVTANNSVGLGYGTGSGGTVTQVTSKVTAVTLNKPSGQITTTADSMAGGATVTFTVANTCVKALDFVGVSLRYTGRAAGTYSVDVSSIDDDQFGIVLKNTSGTAYADAILINFTVIKGSAS